ncbi:MEMO1 family protein Mho1p [[Candida] railenensis]|uniref:MEMO1 family protein Mho1p n=1 Tax=[Candida] railenensis TaxID=45579 RepID=A0A9P0QML8_9ASCO|nr:MEMO1 family protein Mho1p [[Candida] railenensis]
MSVRPSTHAGSWYSGSSSKLSQQLDSFFKQASPSRPIGGARVLIGPHAGFTYSGARLAETFKSWDTSKVRRVFILGPSHHVFFKGKALVSPYDFYETPIGNLPVDSEINDVLTESSHFKYMSEEVDENEHSFEMHAPFIYYAAKSLPQGIPKIVPIMICGTDESLDSKIVKSLLPYLEQEENTFIISSDFCHWGSRFDYTKYMRNAPSASHKQMLSSADLIDLSSLSSTTLERPIYKSIEDLDKEAMRIATSGSYLDWKEYIKVTGNTICGQKPIAIILRLLEKYKEERTGTIEGFKWIGYSQSGRAKSYHDSSVSYASGYIALV